jgi:hypothetical protein
MERALMWGNLATHPTWLKTRMLEKCAKDRASFKKQAKAQYN